MMAQSRAESTRDTYNYGQYINQFPPNTIKVIWEFERIQKKIYRHKRSIMFNEICISMYIYIFTSDLTEYTRTYIYGGAHGVMVIVAGFGHGDTSSNPGLIAFHIALIPLGKV